PSSSRDSPEGTPKTGTRTRSAADQPMSHDATSRWTVPHVGGRHAPGNCSRFAAGHKEQLRGTAEAKSREKRMSAYDISRRPLAISAAGLAAVAALGLDGSRARAAGKLVRVRADIDIKVLDPGYMIGAMEIPIAYATLPRLAVVAKSPDGWSWTPAPYVEELGQTDGTHIAFELKPGFIWCRGTVGGQVYG